MRPNLPGDSTVDYFRYYAKDYPGVNLLPNGSFEYNQDKIDPAKPVAWVVEGDKLAVNVMEGDAAHDRYKLKLGRQGKAYSTIAPAKAGIYPQWDLHADRDGPPLRLVQRPPLKPRS